MNLSRCKACTVTRSSRPLNLPTTPAVGRFVCWTVATPRTSCCSAREQHYSQTVQDASQQVQVSTCNLPAMHCTACPTQLWSPCLPLTRRHYKHVHASSHETGLEPAPGQAALASALPAVTDLAQADA